MVASVTSRKGVCFFSMLWSTGIVSLREYMLVPDDKFQRCFDPYSRLLSDLDNSFGRRLQTLAPSQGYNSFSSMYNLSRKCMCLGVAHKMTFIKHPLFFFRHANPASRENISRYLSEICTYFPRLALTGRTCFRMY